MRINTSIGAATEGSGLTRAIGAFHRIKPFAARAAVSWYAPAPSHERIQHSPRPGRHEIAPEAARTPNLPRLNLDGLPDFQTASVTQAFGALFNHLDCLTDSILKLRQFRTALEQPTIVLEGFAHQDISSSTWAPRVSMLVQKWTEYVLLHGNVVPNVFPRASEPSNVPGQKPCFDFLDRRTTQELNVFYSGLRFESRKLTGAVTAISIGQEKKEMEVSVSLNDRRNERYGMLETRDLRVGQHLYSCVRLATLVENPRD